MTQKINELEKLIRIVNDFPKTGISFKDITPLLEDKFNDTIDAMSDLINWNEIDYLIGIESRGFIFASALAQKHSKGFIPIRKKGKLPPPVLSQKYDLEYGSDILEIASRPRSGRALIVDDVIATGGTLKAAIQLCQNVGLETKQALALINLTFLNQAELHQQIKMRSLFNY